ncbi:MAG: hypothetical protein RLZZ301_396 [Bacteroidota bacterium]|jgi:3-deoxy-D-manno-octulosonic-acid transferase
MHFFYRFFIFVYALLLKLVSFWHPKAKSLVLGRKATWAQLQKLPKTTNKRFWFHCASLGEYDMALPLIEACVAANPGLEIVLSFYSPSGMQHYHKRGFEPHFVFYLPLDTPGAMHRLIGKLAADRLYLLKYEFWPNLLKQAQRQKLPVYSVSTRLRPHQLFFKWYGAYFRKALHRVTYFSVQDEQTRLLLRKIKIPSAAIELGGDLRYHRVVAAKKRVLQQNENELLKQFAADSPLLIAGSSWPLEEEILVNWFYSQASYKLLIAPHDLSAAHLQQLLQQFPDAVCYTDLTESATTARVLILNTIGHLSAAYRYGTVAFVGGGFSGKLHNILEPLAYGLPVLFGPKHAKFPEAAQFMALGYAKEVTSQASFAHVIAEITASVPNHEGICHALEAKCIPISERLIA